MKTANSKISETATTSGAAEIIGSIEDLLTQILVHLPLKPLVRFKLVSKHWNSIISDPKLQFLRNQVHSIRAVSLIFQDFPTRVVVSFEYNKSSSSNPPPSPQTLHQIPETLRIFHSCNGLLVLTDTEMSKNDYYVYNPTTNQQTTILRRDDIDRTVDDTVVGMYLAFDPTKSPHYKVVCLWDLNDWYNDEEETYELEVYSSETRSWEKRGGGEIFSSYVDFDNGVYWNGAIHWITFDDRESMYFDPDHDEMPRLMPSPPIREMNRYFFGESCGHLHFVDIRDDDEELPGIEIIYVHEMRRDYSEWFVKYRVDGYSQSLGNYRYNVQECIYSVVRGKKDEDSFLVFGTDEGEMLRYNLVHKTFVKAFDFNSSCSMTRSFQYIESTCSV